MEKLFGNITSKILKNDAKVLDNKPEVLLRLAGTGWELLQLKDLLLFRGEKDLPVIVRAAAIWQRL